MKSALTIFIVAGFIGVAVFGFTAMGHREKGQGHAGCLAVLASRADCPEEANALAAAAFHLITFKSFSNGLIDAGAATALLAIAGLAAAAFGILIANDLNSFTPGLELIKKNNPALSHTPAVRRLNRWLALHEQSPGA